MSAKTLVVDKPLSQIHRKVLVSEYDVIVIKALDKINGRDFDFLKSRLKTTSQNTAVLGHANPTDLGHFQNAQEL